MLPCLPLMVYQCRLRCMTVVFVVVVILRVRGIWIVKAAKNFILGLFLYVWGLQPRSVIVDGQ